MSRTTIEALTNLNFLVGTMSDTVIGQGIQINWDRVTDDYRAGVRQVQLNGAAAAGATSLTVDALPGPIENGTVLNFGSHAPVTVTVGAAGALANATSIPVNALSGPIPNGTVLDFTGVGEYARLTAAAATGATSLTVEALDAALEAGDTALFPGGAQDALVTADAPAGATTVTVDELQFPIADNATAPFGFGSGPKQIKAGTVMAEEAGASRLYVPRSVAAGAEFAGCLIVSNAEEGEVASGYSGFGELLGAVVWENLLPDAVAGVIPAAYKTEMNDAGCTFVYRQYSDSR